MTTISVNSVQARRMGERLVQLGWRSSHSNLVAALPTGSSPEQAIDYFFFTSMLLFDFKHMRAVLPEGMPIKGTDLFYHLAKRAGERQPAFWTAAFLANLGREGFYRAFSLSNDAAQPSVSRMDERYAMIQEAAQVLLDRYGGSSMGLLQRHPALRAAEGQGLLEVIGRTFTGYQDPLHKKFFVFLKALAAANLWQPNDPQNLMMPIDYHVIRLALRNGIVTVHDQALAQKLRSAAPATPDEEHAIREAVMAAFQEMIEASRLSVFLIDEIYWLVGRSCCDYSRLPRCKTCDFTDCTVQPAFGYTCPGNCPLAADCLGAGDDAYSSLLEPNIVTTYY